MMLQKRVALVTGGNRGLGFETCRQLACKGVQIMLGSRDEEKGRLAARQLRDEGLAVEAVHLDLTDQAHRKAIAGDIGKRYGKLDILVNNAGMLHPDESFFHSSVETLSTQALHQTFAVNFFATVALTQELLPLLKQSEAGRIVNVSSILGSIGLHSDRPPWLEEMKPFAYNASKCALNQFTVHLAAALKGTAIKVNSAHPGWVKTTMGTDRAPMQIPAGAKTVVNLALLDADGPTGAFLHLGKRIPW